ncbi:MAG: phage shock protein E [Gammaproteobacteria bacterium]|jgi:phage shock protein E
MLEKESMDTWIDVRTPMEYQQSSITGHSNISHTDITNNISQFVSDKDAPIFFYCGSGQRAGIAKTALEELGYTNVTNAGGIEEVRQKFKTN